MIIYVYPKFFSDHNQYHTHFHCIMPSPYGQEYDYELGILIKWHGS